MADAIDKLLADVPASVREWVRSCAPHIQHASQVRELVAFWAEPDGCGNPSRAAETERKILLEWLAERAHGDRLVRHLSSRMVLCRSPRFCAGGRNSGGGE